MKAGSIPSEMLAQKTMPHPLRHHNSLQHLHTVPCNSSMAITMCFHQELYLILQKQVPGGVLQGFSPILKDPKTFTIAAVPCAVWTIKSRSLKSDHHVQIQQPKLSSILYLIEPTAFHEKCTGPLDWDRPLVLQRSCKHWLRQKGHLKETSIFHQIKGWKSRTHPQFF